MQLQAVVFRYVSPIGIALIVSLKSRCIKWSAFCFRLNRFPNGSPDEKRSVWIKCSRSASPEDTSRELLTPPMERHLGHNTCGSHCCHCDIFCLVVSLRGYVFAD